MQRYQETTHHRIGIHNGPGSGIAFLTLSIYRPFAVSPLKQNFGTCGPRLANRRVFRITAETSSRRQPRGTCMH